MMMDQKYRVRVNREPLVSGDRSNVRKKRWITWGIIAGVVLLLLIIGLIALGGRDAETTQDAGSAELTLQVERGTVQVKQADDEEFIDATDGMRVQQGVTVRTEDEGLAMLELIVPSADDEASGSVVRLNQDSRVEVTEASAEKLAVTLLSGETWTTVAGATPPSTAVSATAVRVEAQSTSYDVTTDEDQTTVRAVSDTSVVTAVEEGDKGKLFLDEDQQVTVEVDSVPESEDDFEADDIDAEFKESFWFRWNTEQDQEFAARLAGSEDSDGPTLTITSPEDGTETEDQRIEIKGVTDVSATVTIEGDEVDTEDGEFSQEVELDEGENKITIIATDPSGNETEEVLTIIRKAGKPDAVSVSLNTDETDSILVTWEQSDIEDFGSYVLKRDEEVIERFTDKSITEFRDDTVAAGETYTYNVCVVDADGQEACSQDQSATVKGDPNQAPSVSISSPADGTSFKGGSAVSFSASGSDPDDGDTLTYTWEFGDGVSTTGKDVSHTYSVTSANKSYTVMVTVSDRAGASAESTISITVTP